MARDSNLRTKARQLRPATDYIELAKELEALVSGDVDRGVNAANAAAAIYHSLPGLSWSGFYFLRGDELILGPFQGMPALARIKLGAGIQGIAAADRRSLLLDDPEHLLTADPAACSALAKPLIANGQMLGIIYLESPLAARFAAADLAGFEPIVKVLADAFSRGQGSYANIVQGTFGSYIDHNSGTIMDDAAIDLNAAADSLGLSKENALEALRQAAADAEGEITGRAEGEPRPRTIADVKAEALAIGDTTLLGQLVRYEARLASIELPADGLTSPEQAQAAARLAKTYQDLRARQFEGGLDPLPQDDRVTEAQRLASDFYRKHPKPKVKKATRSPPRRRNSTRTASPT